MECCPCPKHNRSKRRRACDSEGNVKKMRRSDRKKLARFMGEPDNLELIKSYQEAGNNVNATYRSSTPLCSACRSGNVGVIEYLVSAGADPNMTDANKATPLYIAASNGHENIVELLLKSGADPDIQNMYGYSALMSAVTNGMHRVTEILMNAGATVNVLHPNTYGVDVSILSYVLFANSDWNLARRLLMAGTLPHKFIPPLDFVLLDDPVMPVEFIKLLLDAGFDLYCKGWIAKVERSCDEMTERQAAVLRLITQYHTQPRSMMESCRIVIRVAIAQQTIAKRKHFREKIETLPLPKSIKRFLSFETDDNFNQALE